MKEDLKLFSSYLKGGIWRVGDSVLWHSHAKPSNHMRTMMHLSDEKIHNEVIVERGSCGNREVDLIFNGNTTILFDTIGGFSYRKKIIKKEAVYKEWRIFAQSYVNSPSFEILSDEGLIKENLIFGDRLVSESIRSVSTEKLFTGIYGWTKKRLICDHLNFKCLSSSELFRDALRCKPIPAFLLENLQRLGSCRTLINHGDVSPWNIVIDKDDPVLIDWEFCHYHVLPWWYDLVTLSITTNQPHLLKKVRGLMSELNLGVVSSEEIKNDWITIATVFHCLARKEVSEKAFAERHNWAVRYSKGLLDVR